MKECLIEKQKYPDDEVNKKAKLIRCTVSILEDMEI